MLHVSSFSQCGIHRSKRANARGPVEVPAEFVLPDSAARNGVVDIPDLRSHTLNQLSDALPSALPCTSCGGWKVHWPWCPTLGLNVRVSFHPKKLIGLDGTCQRDRTPQSFAENSV